MKKIFISYSHDSEQHKDRVLALSNRLKKDGLDCILDRYVENPVEGWPKWMDRRLEEAEKVIIICTRTYYDRVMDKEPQGIGKGVKWESILTYQYIYDADSKNDKFIAVVFDEDDSRFIPTALKGFTHYCVAAEEGYDKLYRRLTRQPEIIEPEIGRIKERPPRKTPWDFTIDASPPGDRISLSKMPTTGQYLFGRDEQLAFLDKAWNDPHIYIVILIAWGGVGKTALVNHWLNLLAEKDYCGAKRVYAWSFYSQGAAEGKQASADDFMQTTLEWFGASLPEQASSVDKARHLVHLLRQERTLLILDGLEPLQYPPNELEGFAGRLKDQGLKTLLKELAAGQPGLCVITSRESVTDLDDKKDHAVREIGLENLPAEAGVELLKKLGVRGVDRELAAAVQEYEGHALALTLLGNYLSSVFDGDIRRRDKIPALTQDKKKGSHARRVMEAYERRFGESAETDFLRIMGLFDRPAAYSAIEALLAGEAIPGNVVDLSMKNLIIKSFTGSRGGSSKEPLAAGGVKSTVLAIPGITAKLQGLPETERQWALTNLRSAGLLAKEGKEVGQVRQECPTYRDDRDERLDCHPLVREHFGEKLREQNPEGWREAHKRLYEYYKKLPEKEFPDTLAEMDPLFAAVSHGCAAGLHNEAMDEVYWPRILRKEEFYCTKKLGAFGADLAALSHFFEVPWAVPAPGLTEHDKASVLNWAGFRLRAVGRLIEALQPMKAGLEMHIKQEDWAEAAKDAGNLSELLLTLGKVDQAVDYARQAVKYADKSEDAFQKEAMRTTLADALHQQGQLAEAEQLFLEAEALQQERQPQYRYLYSLQGYQFCDLMLSLGRAKEVKQRAEEALEIVLNGSRNLLDIALNNLAIGRARLLLSLEEKSGDLSEAADYLRQAVDGLRKSGDQDYLALALIKRAECYRLAGSFEQARTDLQEALEIAESGGMKLYLTDYHLESGRLCLAEGRDADAKHHFQKAAALIDETGYHRRDGDIEVEKVRG